MSSNMISVNDTFPQRYDRLFNLPSADNAQGVFPPAACLFVGNLSTRVPAEKMINDLTEQFSRFGKCYVKVKDNGRRNLPVGFLQFEKTEEAQAALAHDGIWLHGRLLRVELAKGRRTASLAHRSLAPMAAKDVFEALVDRGPLEFYALEPVILGSNWYGGFDCTTICIVTFAFVDDCKDAIKHFQNSVKYEMKLLPVDGNPLSSWRSTPSPIPIKVNFGKPSESLPSSPQTSTTVEKGLVVGERHPPESQSICGRKIERAVREVARERGVDLGEEGLLEVIKDLQEEWRDKYPSEATVGTAERDP